MTQPLIDISPDDTHPEGGHAIVLVRGVTELPDPVRFTISALPDDPDEAEADTEWSLGEQAPLSAELASDGLIMKLGPDIVDAPELQPGTPIAFTLPAAKISTELSWPDLPVTIQASLPIPLMDPTELRVHKIENSRREAAAAAQAEADKAVVDAIAASLSGYSTPHDAARDANKLKPMINLADISAAMGLEATAAERPLASSMNGATANLGHSATPSMPALNLALDWPPDAARRDTQTAADAAPPRLAGTLSSSRAMVPVSHAVVVTTQRDSAARRNWLSIVLAIIAIPAILLALWPSLSTRVVEQPTVQAALKQFASSDWVTRIFAVGDVSPEGLDASDVSADEALKRAEAAIFDENNKANLAERRFWLRKSISLMLAKPDTRWAMTQLGALHTAAPAPQEKPEYRSAKTLWEIASASGDTVATCFLAQLYELGLGVVSSPEKAQEWQARAAERGGCNVQHERRAPALTN